jgi:hypothetical protein
VRAVDGEDGLSVGPGARHPLRHHRFGRPGQRGARSAAGVDATSTPLARILASFSARRVPIAANCRASVSRAACATASRAGPGSAYRAAAPQKWK